MYHFNTETLKMLFVRFPASVIASPHSDIFTDSVHREAE